MNYFKNFKSLLFTLLVINTNILSMERDFDLEKTEAENQNKRPVIQKLLKTIIDIKDLENRNFILKSIGGSKKDKDSMYCALKKAAFKYCKTSGILEKYWNDPEVWQQCKNSGINCEIPYEEPIGNFIESEFPQKNIYAYDFSFSPCGNYIAILEHIPHRIYMLDIKNSEILFTITQQGWWQSIRYTAQFSPDGKYIVYCLEESVIKRVFIIICDAKTGKEIKRFDKTDLLKDFNWPKAKFNKDGTEILLQQNYHKIFALSLNGRVLEKYKIKEYIFNLDEHLSKNPRFHPYNTGSIKFELHSQNTFTIVENDSKHEWIKINNTDCIRVFTSIKNSKNERVCEFEYDYYSCKFNKKGTFFAGTRGNFTIYPTPKTLLKRKSLKALLSLIDEYEKK